MNSGAVVVAGSVAQKPHQAGHTWVFLQYLLGFRRLGWDVLLLDRLEPEMAIDATGRPCPIETSVNISYLRDVMAEFGLGDAFAVYCDGGRDVIGLSREQVLARVRDASVLINVMGFFTDPDVLGNARRRVFFDIDPGFGQMWQSLGWHDPYPGYDDYVTVGEHVGHDGCVVPDCGLRWITTRQPVVLETWPAAGSATGGAFTSIGAWRGPYAPVEYGGRTYGLRAHEFRRFAELPGLTGEPFEVALDIHSAETRDLALLDANGWRLADPRVVAREPIGYQNYIAGSKAEFMVAKNMYVQSKSGWFSDRSICYLASGRPVLAQNTGLDDLYPLGRGLVVFSTLEEAVAGVEEITANYQAHCRAAREIAEEYFDSDRVLTRLLDSLAVS
jgi:hypothetical protein